MPKGVYRTPKGYRGRQGLALVVKKPWIDLILKRRKTWEIRGMPTNKRGRIELAESGTNQVVGSVEIIDCIPLSRRRLADPASIAKHRVVNTRRIQYPTVYAWVLKRAKRYRKPSFYLHPNGAITWVDLKKHSEAKGESRIKGVCRDARSKKFYVSKFIKGKRYYDGMFEREVEAIRALQKVLKLHGLE
eukprot:CAMPEP_0169103684 /NCGR_PEP_ID=MMETSP1015-20121227/22849_1 /TAXON_ID=342587 /ORGANISM="Karlodinium micrum, Strain CCMP2283" /LENGTH=188 /DNA_ID=CAMNT_0009164903 /DNA_START=64 /DNA_END=630 /DNA_ORIENTATION=+